MKYSLKDDTLGGGLLLFSGGGDVNYPPPLFPNALVQKFDIIRFYWKLNKGHLLIKPQKGQSSLLKHNHALWKYLKREGERERERERQRERELQRELEKGGVS